MMKNWLEALFGSMVLAIEIVPRTCLIGFGYPLEANGGELTLDAVAGAADADALGVAALDHEAGDDPVEDQSVIEVLFDKLAEICSSDRCILLIKFDLDGMPVFHFNNNHVISPCVRILSQVWFSFHRIKMHGTDALHGF